MPVRGLLVDNMGKGTTVCLTLLYFGALLTLAIGASLTPDRFERQYHPLDPAACDDPASCVVDVNAITLNGLTPGNQFLMLAGRMERPLVLATGLPALKAYFVEYDMTYRFSLTHADSKSGDVTTLFNLSHTTRVTCDERETDCVLGVLAYLPAVFYDSISVDMQLEKPVLYFQRELNGEPLVPFVNVTFTHVMVRDAYTAFEIGWRYFGVGVSLLVWLLYTIMLCCGAGTTDEATGKRVRTTFEQRYVWWLSVLAVFLDRPGFATEVITPTLESYAFGAVTQTTAMAAILFFFLFHFHLIALQSEAGASGVQWDVAAYGEEPVEEMDPAVLAARRSKAVLGPCFYIPKVILVTLGWAISLALLLYSRWMQLTDPGFSVWETYPIFGQFLTNFSYVVGALYLFLLLFYMALGLRRCRGMPRSGLFFTLITVITVLVTVAGVFANTYTNTLNASGFYVVAFGLVNVYIWMLCIFFSPAKRLTLREMTRNAKALARGEVLPHVTGGDPKHPGDDDFDDDVAYDPDRATFGGRSNGGGVIAGVVTHEDMRFDEPTPPAAAVKPAPQKQPALSAQQQAVLAAQQKQGSGRLSSGATATQQPPAPAARPSPLAANNNGGGRGFGGARLDMEDDDASFGAARPSAPAAAAGATRRAGGGASLDEARTSAALERGWGGRKPSAVV